jgi:SnoaL-like polyketide cyclase
MSVSPREVIRRLYKEVWNERKLEVIDQLVSQSHALISPLVLGPGMGPAAYKKRDCIVRRGFSGLAVYSRGNDLRKGQIVASWTFTGTHKGEFLGIAPTNKKVPVTGITIHQTANGKILDSQATWDAISLFQQLGVELPIKLGRRAASTT